jgi:hypothetical protein
MGWKKKSTKTSINDVTPNSSTTYSSSKIESTLTNINTSISNKANISHTHTTSNITDIDTTNKTNGYALQYDSATGKFVSKALPGGTGSGATSLDGLSDVDVSTFVPLEGDFLKYVGGVWKASSSTNVVIPQEVTDFQATNIGQTTLTLSWTASSGATSYDILKDGIFLINTTTSSYNVIGLESGMQYNFTVKAKNSAGAAAGVSINATSLLATPQLVTNLEAINITQTTLTLSWTASNGATSYDILMNGNFLINTLSTSYNVTGLTLNTQYVFTVKAKNSAGTSAGVVINVNTIGEVTADLIFNLDLSGKSGVTSNTINDTVNNIPCTLYNVVRDGNDGFLDDKGLTLKTNGYVGIPIGTGTLRSLININTTGVTFEFVAYNAIGMIMRTNGPTTLKTTVGTTVVQTAMKYTSTDTTDKSTYTQYSAFGPVGATSQGIDTLHGTKELNVITVRFYPDGKYDILLNGKPSTTQGKPSDFADYFDMLASPELYVRRDEVGSNTAGTKLRAFSIYNKPLSNEEALQSYNNYKNTEPLDQMFIYPTSVSIDIGENQTLAVVASPMKYTNLVTNVFESGNAGFVTVNENGVLTGVAEGDTTIGVTTTYLGQTLNNGISITVGSSDIEPPASTRTITGISLNRQTQNLNVGEEFLALATTLPFDVFYDNIVTWQSSDPSVCTVNLGVLKGIAPGTAVITATDGAGVYSKNFTVTVSVPVVVTITAEETYNVVLTEYDIDAANAVNSTNGIQNALNYASTNGYKKIVFPTATYQVTPDARTINMPTNMVVDFSNSSINIELSSKTPLGYIMFYFDKVTNTKLINAKIYGEIDYTTLPYASEGCQSVVITEAVNSGFENCTFSKSPGFNVQSTMRLVKTGTTGTSIPKTNFEVGSINASGVNDDSITTFSFRSINYLNISGLGSYYMIGYTQGYFGYNYLRSRLYSIFFYDVNYTFISAQMHNLQFINYDKPANAKYAKIIIYQDVAPTSQDNDFNAVAFIRTMGMAQNCFIKNCTFEENGSCGLALSGGQNWLVEGNYFAKNGRRMPNCDVDWEDGWDTMIGDIVRNNTFNSTNGMLLCAGMHAVHDNTFNKSGLTVYGRTQNWRIFSNFFNGKGYVSLSTQAESYFSRNTLSVVRYATTLQHPTASYRIRDTNNTLI